VWDVSPLLARRAAPMDVVMGVVIRRSAFMVQDEFSGDKL
jgi:hypothetical protein